jgi:hypothetical protein
MSEFNKFRLLENIEVTGLPQLGRAGGKGGLPGRDGASQGSGPQAPAGVGDDRPRVPRPKPTAQE